MLAKGTATVQMLGDLRLLRMQRGLAATVEVAIPPCGFAASVLARDLGLPLERIEAVLVNHQGFRLDHCIKSGDRVAFVPKEQPGETAAHWATNSA